MSKAAAAESSQHNRTRPPPLKILFSLTFNVFVVSPVFQFLLEICYTTVACYCTVILLLFGWLIAYHQEGKKTHTSNRTHSIPFSLSHLHTQNHTRKYQHTPNCTIRTVDLRHSVYIHFSMFLLLFYFHPFGAISFSLSLFYPIPYNLSWMYLPIASI